MTRCFVSFIGERVQKELSLRKRSSAPTEKITTTFFCLVQNFDRFAKLDDIPEILFIDFKLPLKSLDGIFIFSVFFLLFVLLFTTKLMERNH